MRGSLFARTGDSRRAELDVLHAVTDAAQLPCQRPDLADESKSPRRPAARAVVSGDCGAPLAVRGYRAWG